MTALGIILGILSGMMALAAIVVILRIVLANSAIPRARSGDTMPPAPGLLSIVIPAHNEERVIEASVRGLRAQTRRNFEAIYVLDRCSDRTRARLTGAIEGDARIRIIDNDSCPADWAGKCNACRIGAETATGEWILFTDADCRFAPEVIDSMISIAHSRQTALLSALGRLTFVHRFERVLQPVAAAVLLRIFPLDKANRTRKRWPFANGQFLLFRREKYDALGGHAAVKDDLLEDLAFAREVHARGWEIGVVDATRRMEVAMYDSVPAMRSGWTRIYIESCCRVPWRLQRSAIELLLLSVVLPLASLAATIVGALGALRGDGGAVTLTMMGVMGLALGFSAVALIHQRQRAPLLTVLIHPIAAAIVAMWLFDGARMLQRRVPVRWGGREYVLQPRTANGRNLS